MRFVERATPLGIEPRISGSVDQRLIHWAMESDDRVPLDMIFD